MAGGIYTEQKCPICGGPMKDDKRSAVRCPVHNNQIAISLIVRFGPKVSKRFREYKAAQRFLNGVRFKTDEKSFDERDYKKDSPLAFSNLVQKYLAVKEESIKASSLSKVRCDLGKAEAHFGDQNVKTIRFAEIEDFFMTLRDLSSKTRFNVRSNLHAFFVWLVRRREIRADQMPEFPELTYELGWRKTIDVDTQSMILEEVKRITRKNPRIHMAVSWLTTYINMRPGELLGILEEDVDHERGIVFIRDHKTDRQTQDLKIIPLLKDDLDLLQSLPQGFPKMYLFRRDRGGGGRFAGSPFGKHLLWVTWKQACSNLGIVGVDLYGGTRHSSAQALREQLSPEGVRRLTGHTTNKAFERYYKIDAEEMREGYAKVRCKQNVNKKSKSRLSRIGSPS